MSKAKYSADCSACGENVQAGNTCGCGNLMLDSTGRASTLQGSGEYRYEPNVVVVEGEAPAEDDTADAGEPVERGGTGGDAGKPRAGVRKPS